MRIQVCLGLIVSLCGTMPAQSAARDVYSVQAVPVAPVADLITSTAGHGLTLTECVDRLEQLGVLLRDRGYGPKRDEEFEPGVFVTRWYRSGTRTAIVAWMGANGAAHDLEVVEFAWDHPWSQWLTPY